MIPLILFVVFSFLYVVISMKVKQWETITILGFKTETPEGYLRNPGAYNLTRLFCFLIAVIGAIFSSYKYSATIGFPVLGILWFFVNNRGIDRGIKEYRRVMKETVNSEYLREEGGDFYEHAKKSLELTDKQIYEMYKENLRLHTMLRK